MNKHVASELAVGIAATVAARRLRHGSVEASVVAGFLAAAANYAESSPDAVLLFAGVATAYWSSDRHRQRGSRRFQ